MNLYNFELLINDLIKSGSLFSALGISFSILSPKSFNLYYVVKFTFAKSFYLTLIKKHNN